MRNYLEINNTIETDFSHVRRNLINSVAVSFVCMVIVLFPITTLFQYYISVLNKAVFAMLFAGIILSLLTRPRKKVLLYFIGICLLWMIAMLRTSANALSINRNMAYYYLFCCLFFIFFMENKVSIFQKMYKQRKYVFYLCALYTVIVSISIFLPSSYRQVTAGGWGDTAYFMSISESPNRVGPASLFIIILLIFLIQNGYSKIIAVMSVPQLYVFLMGGSRTYFVLGICAVGLLVYILFESKHLFFVFLLPLSVLLLLILINSSMFDKFSVTFGTGLSSYDFLRKITNSRSVFWVSQLIEFSKSNFVGFLFGNGINFTSLTTGIWGHNDFIEILCSYGIIGLINYIVLAFLLFKTFFANIKSFLVKFCCVFIWLFNAFFNFYYCYFCAMLSLPILLLSFSMKSQVNQNI